MYITKYVDLMGYIRGLFRLGIEVKKWLDKACHVQTVYNATDFSYRPSVGKQICWEILDARTTSVAMG